MESFIRRAHKTVSRWAQQVSLNGFPVRACRVWSLQLHQDVEETCRHTWSPCGAPLCGSLRRRDTNTHTILHGPPQHVRGRTGAALSSCHPVWRCSREAASQDSLSRLCHGGLWAFLRDGCNQPVSLPFRVQYSQGEVLILKAREVFGKSSSSGCPLTRVIRDPQQIQREGLINDLSILWAEGAGTLHSVPAACQGIQNSLPQTHSRRVGTDPRPARGGWAPALCLPSLSPCVWETEA